MPGSHSMSGGHSLPGSQSLPGVHPLPGGSMAPPVQIKQEPGMIKIKQEKQEVMDDRQNIMASLEVPDFFMDSPAGVSPPTTTRDPPHSTSFMHPTPMLGHNYPPPQSHHQGIFIIFHPKSNTTPPPYYLFKILL